MAHYLVTGGAGFIGSHLCEELIRRGERVRVVDSLITGKRENLAHLPQVEFLQGDLADIDVARRAVQGIEYVLHHAAIPSVPRSVEDPVTSNRANIDASLSVLVAARVLQGHVRLDFERDGALRQRVWSLKGTERTLLLDVHHKKLEPKKD